MASILFRAAEASAPSLQPAGALALPVKVETAAWAVSIAGELRVLINHPGVTATTQLRVLPTHGLEPLPSLPIVVAGAADCGQDLLVTGADADGHPLALGVEASGKVAWQSLINGPTPTRWPVPGCVPHPVVVWQTAQDKLEVARCGPGGITHQRSISIGGPPLDVAIGGHSIWSSWPTSSEIQCAEIGEHDVRTVSIAATSPSSIAIGASPKGACIAWTQGSSSFFARIVSEAKPSEPPLALDLVNAVNGTLSIVSGPEPLIWAQRGQLIEGEAPRWISALVLPGDSPLLVEGLVHAVAWWGDGVAVVGSEEIRFLKRVTKAV
jgi:hypothetical protein